jgi:hypothetical protein
LNVALLLMAVATTAGAVQAVPNDGLRLHLDAARNVQRVGGRVVSWTDLSPAGHVAVVPGGFQPPTYQTGSQTPNGHPVLSFRDRQVLSITGRVLPADSRQLTILAVARSDGPTGVGIFSVRQASVPLVQLDSDDTGRARFIVRDRQHQTVQALGQPYPRRWGIYIGILEQVAGGASRVDVQFGAHRGESGLGPLTGPLVGDQQWIGALPLAGRTLSWNGEIAELLVYDCALNAAQREQVARSLCEKYGIRYEWKPEELAVDVYPWRTEPKPADAHCETDVCIVGAGSAGIGAALAAARRGARVVLVERQQTIGGTGVNALVSCWEPGPGCSIAREIFDRLSLLPGAVGVAGPHPNLSSGFPLGQWYVTPEGRYEQTVRRAEVAREQMRCVPYDPLAFERVCRQLLDETGSVSLLDETTFFHARIDQAGKRIESVLVEDARGRVTEIRARVFIDCTGCVHLCRAAGCEVMLGADPRDRFDEPSAPDQAALQLNAISRCYAIRPSGDPGRQPPVEPPVPHLARCAHVTGWPDGVRVVNPLPMLPGRALIDLGYEQCLEITDKAVRAHWHWLQSTPDFAGYEFDRVAPMLGIRESYRVVTRYVLTEHDLAAGLDKQPHDDIIAVADHPCDIHGAGGHLKTVNGRYGIPYRCLVPAGGWENLLVACRGAGFSKIAASSCRLQRTMIQLGHAAGAAAAGSVQADVPVDRIDIPALVRELAARER